MFEDFFHLCHMGSICLVGGLHLSFMEKTVACGKTQQNGPKGMVPYFCYGVFGLHFQTSKLFVYRLEKLSGTLRCFYYRGFYGVFEPIFQ